MDDGVASKLDALRVEEAAKASKRVEAEFGDLGKQLEEQAAALRMAKQKELELLKRQREVEYLISVAEPDPDYQPLFSPMRPPLSAPSLRTSPRFGPAAGPAGRMTGHLSRTDHYRRPGQCPLMD